MLMMYTVCEIPEIIEYYRGGGLFVFLAASSIRLLS